ncbi:hypothetical protein SAMN05878494_5378 [Bacillus cereus]|nr:hypothetical protein SAMN05878494_5378 [Bacillus cereus]
MKKTKKILSGALATMLLVGGISSTSFAAESINPVEVNQESAEMKQLAADIQFVFEEASTIENGKYVVDEKKIADKFGQENVLAITTFVNFANGEEVSTNNLRGLQDSPTGKIDKGGIQYSWSSCVGSKIIDATGIGFISGGMWKLIERQAWQQLAIELAKVVGKNAIKGGIVGFAASLAWYGTSCIGK